MNVRAVQMQVHARALGTVCAVPSQGPTNGLLAITRSCETGQTPSTRGVYTRFWHQDASIMGGPSSVQPYLTERPCVPQPWGCCIRLSRVLRAACEII